MVIDFACFLFAWYWLVSIIVFKRFVNKQTDFPTTKSILDFPNSKAEKSVYSVCRKVFFWFWSSLLLTESECVLKTLCLSEAFASDSRQYSLWVDLSSDKQTISHIRSLFNKSIHLKWPRFFIKLNAYCV